MSNYWEGVFDVIPDFVALLDRDGKIVKANKALREHIDLPEGQILGRECRDMIRCGFCDTENCTREMALTKGESITRELLNSNLGVPVLVTASIINDVEHGEVIGFVLTAKDITEQKKQEKELAESKALYKCIITSMSEGLLLIDENLIITFANPALCRIAGVNSFNELIGLDVTAFLANGNQYEEVIKQQLEGKQGISHIGEWTIVSKDNEAKQIRTSSVPRFDNGVYKGALLVITDLTALRRKEKELSELKSSKRQLRIGELLIEKNILTFKQLKEALRELKIQRENIHIGEMFIKKGFIDRATLESALLEQIKLRKGGD